MEPITFSIVSGLLFLAYDKYKKNKEAQAVPGARAPAPTRTPGSDLESFVLPSIGPAEVESFTHVVGGVRHFDRGVSRGLPSFLAGRSAFPISSGPLSQAAPSARVFRVMPLAPGAPTAADVLDQAHRAGQTVLGTLTLIALPLGRQDPMLLIVGGPELRAFVAAAPGQRGDFAILPAPTPAAVATAQPAPPSPAAVVDAAPIAVPAAPIAAAAAPIAAPTEAPPIAAPTEVKTEVMAAPPKPRARPNGKKDEPEPPPVIVTEGEVKA